jgi:2-polyprenyl-3-methyl-5-hydroxy-6-metoxy-1,4-benzoquinol methylase
MCSQEGGNPLSEDGHTLESSREALRRNIIGNNRIATRYDTWHPEIFTEIEQERLAESLARAVAAVESGGSPPLVLDFGCGSGNLTRHLVELGCDVVAADVAPRFLKIIQDKFGSTGQVEVLKLNGNDLSALAGRSFDMIATYSVLHHLADYSGTVAELAGLLRPGGVLFIDHEWSERRWDGDPIYDEFLQKVWTPPPPHKKTIARFFKPRNYYNKARDLYYQYSGLLDQGDIHVYPEDHIEWARMEEALHNRGLLTVFSEDYLNFWAHYDVAVYEAFKDRTADMHVLAMRRPAIAASASE